MKNLIKKLSVVLVITALGFSALAQDAKKDRAIDLDALLKQLEDGKFQVTTKCSA